jgi:hypothetical protein
MTRSTTFKTTETDCAADVTNRTGEYPEITHIGGGIFEYRFHDKDAPEAARRFRNDGRLQAFLAAKRTVYRLFRDARDRE